VIVAGVAAAAVVAAVVLVVVDPFGRGPPSGGVADNTYPTAIQRVVRQNLSSQTNVDGTLGYASAGTIAAPAGTTPSAVAQAQQALASAQSAARTAQSTLVSDEATLTQARAVLAADRAKETTDCSGDNAAAASGVCAADQQAVAADEQAATGDSAKVAGDKSSSAAAALSLSSADRSFATAQSSASAYEANATFTELPPVGDVVTRGRTLYEVSGTPVVLLYGTVAPWRAFGAGMTPGRDVAELNANLRALGYGDGLAGDAFTSATESAVESFQAARGLPRTGSVPLGLTVFAPGAVRVTSVTATDGATVAPGPVLTVTSTTRLVTVELDASQQSDVKKGDRVTITLPDNSTTPGIVSSVGTVATAPSQDNGNGPGGNPTVEVDITPSDPAATGHLDQAPVSVSIVTAAVKNALVVPVDALLALAGGGYAVEEVGAGGVHTLLPVTLGLFDDADGLVQVTGTGLSSGLRVVVPNV
jgi:hypothetical protein